MYDGPSVPDAYGIINAQLRESKLTEIERVDLDRSLMLYPGLRIPDSGQIPLQYHGGT